MNLSFSTLYSDTSFMYVFVLVKQMKPIRLCVSLDRFVSTVPFITE
jgi:hypothetical protein